MIEELFEGDPHFWEQVARSAQTKMDSSHQSLLEELNGHRKRLFDKCMKKENSSLQFCRNAYTKMKLTSSKTYSPWLYNCITMGMEHIQSQRLDEIRDDVHTLLGSCQQRFSTELSRAYSQQVAEKHQKYYYPDS